MVSATVAEQLRALADRVGELDPARIVGELETLKFTLWQQATAAPAPAVPAHPSASRGLDVADVMQRTGMSRDWLYRQARAGHLPFARHLGRRVVFDEAGLARWLERRR